MNDHDRDWLDRRLREIHRDITFIKVELGKLTIKSGVWGMLGGLIPVLIALCILILKG